MINSKMSMSIMFFMAAGIELLKIKDNYNPNNITDDLVYWAGAFVVTIGIAFALFVTSFKRSHHRHGHS